MRGMRYSVNQKRRALKMWLVENSAVLMCFEKNLKKFQKTIEKCLTNHAC